MTRAALGSAWGLDTEPADDWRHRAACRGEDPELFFPIGRSGTALEQVEQAKAVCRRCSVIDQCLRWALDRPEEYGIWGGLTEGERRAELTRRRTKREYLDMLRERYGDLADIERERPPARPPETDEQRRRALIKAMEAVQ